MGVFAPTVGIIGAMQAAEALRVIGAFGTTLNGRLMMLDSLRWNGPRCDRAAGRLPGLRRPALIASCARGRLHDVAPHCRRGDAEARRVRARLGDRQALSAACTSSGSNAASTSAVGFSSAFRCAAGSPA
jgi:hypothetical protein